MSDGGVLIFAYDGSFDGFLSAVFDAFVLKTLPADIVVFSDMEPSLLKIHYVATDREHAKRVSIGITKKLGGTGYNMVEKAFLFDSEDKESAIMRFIWRGFHGGNIKGTSIGDEDVSRVFKMSTAVNYEAERLRQFTRFSDSNGALVAVIHPKHFILPLIKTYFCNRIKNEHFMIFDAEHGAALIHSPGKTAIIPVESLELPSDTEDKFYCELWKSYYRHIAIESRYNPTCRRAHMPKRFWQYLPEVAEEVESNFTQKLSLGTSAEIAQKLKSEKVLRLE